MQRIRVVSFTLSIDGYAAGPDQSLLNPLGIGAQFLHGWAFATKTFQEKLFGASSGETRNDDNFAARSFDNVGAWILGRNMFGPVRGPWTGDAWRGWWGDKRIRLDMALTLLHKTV